MDLTNHSHNYLLKHASLLKYIIQKVKVMSVVFILFIPYPQSLAEPIEWNMIGSQ